MTNQSRLVALVTGASSGIGKATAEQLVQAGYQVIATCRDPQRAPELSGVEWLPLNLTQQESIQTLARQLEAQAGRLDLLVNNAGGALLGALEETSADELEQQFQLNFFGHCQLIQQLLPMMRKQQGGQIINIGSLLGKVSLPFMGAYSASKFAMAGYSEALATELKPFNIRVWLIEPEFARTAIVQHSTQTQHPIEAYDEARARVSEAVVISISQGIKPETVAAQVVSLAQKAPTRFNHPVGMKAKLISQLLKSAPRFVLDLIWRKEFNL